MGFVGALAGINFEQANMRRVVRDSDRVEHHDARLQTNGRLLFLRENCFVDLDLRGIDFQLRYTNHGQGNVSG